MKKKSELIIKSIDKTKIKSKYNFTNRNSNYKQGLGKLNHSKYNLCMNKNIFNSTFGTSNHVLCYNFSDDNIIKHKYYKVEQILNKKYSKNFKKETNSPNKKSKTKKIINTKINNNNIIKKK